MGKPRLLIVVLATIVLATVLGVGTMAYSTGVANAKSGHIRWDIISAVFAPPPGETNPGGFASAKSQDGFKITLSGSGTFVAPKEGQRSSAVTGGGTWETFDSASIITGNGGYVVTGLVSYHGFVGVGAGRTDNIGDPADARGGLAVLSIEYDDGDHGILIVSCRRGEPGVFEGITASKGFVDYWERQAPVGGIDGNRTLFHVVRNP